MLSKFAYVKLMSLPFIGWNDFGGVLFIDSHINLVL